MGAGGPTRARGRFRWCIPVAVAAAGWMFWACGGRDRDPDVVIFLIDTLRADRLGSYGYERDTTPRIDSLASRSVTFEQAYAPAPWTLPSVVSLMTSTFPCEHGVLVDGERLSESAGTLAEWLGQAGYRTASFYANPYAGDMSGLERGFDSAELRPYSDGQQLREWLREAGQRPFFLYVHNVEPHTPLSPPPLLAARFGAPVGRSRLHLNSLFRRLRSLTRVDFVAGRVPGTSDNSQQQIEIMAELEAAREAVNDLYDAEVRLADTRLGSVIDSLKRRGRWKNTVFVLVSDHGEEFGEHGGWQHDQSLYEELVRVPMLIRFPRDEHGGLRVAEPVSLVDIAPTILAYLGDTEPDRGARGRSLMALIEGRHSELGARVVSFRDNRKKFFRPFREARGERNVALREGRWKAVWNTDLESVELYDLRSDPGEVHDLAARFPDQATRMAEAASSWLASCRQLGRVDQPVEELEAAEMERLRALGYVD